MFKDIKRRLHSKPSQIKSEYVTPIINAEEVMRLARKYVMNDVLAAFEMTHDGFKFTLK